MDVTDGDGRITMEQQKGQRLTDDVARSYHHHALAGDCDLRPVQNFQNGCRRGWHEARQTEKEIARTAKADAIHILARVQRLGDGALGEMRREWELHKNAIHVGVSVECFDSLPQGLVVNGVW